MANTGNVSNTVHAYLEKRVESRRALLSEAIACMVAGDVETGKLVLREYVNGTIGFLKLGEALGYPAKSLMRMLGPRGNPQARNLFRMIAYFQEIEGIVLEVHARDATA